MTDVKESNAFYGDAGNVVQAAHIGVVNVNGRALPLDSLSPTPAVPEGAVGHLPTRSPDMRIFLQKWVNYADSSNPIAERVLRRELPPSQLSTLDAALEELISMGTIVEAVTVFQERCVAVSTTNEFWALLIADLVLHRGRAGDRRWLIEQTSRILRGGNAEQIDQLRLVWQFISELFLQDDDPDGSGLVEDLAADVIFVADSRHQRLYETMHLLLGVTRNGRVAERLAVTLESYGRSLPIGAPPQLRERIQLLRGTASAIVASKPVFAPELITVPSGGLCPYEFETMRFPMTVAEVTAILGLPPGKAIDLHQPHVFDEGSLGLGHILFDLLPTLVGGCRAFDEKPGMRWAVPTAAEWLALAGCEDNPYPWGREAPAPELANLYFGGARGRILPVGVLPQGNSPLGVADCCGNVHEIVEWDQGEFLADAYRLAGGSFQTSSGRASCRRFRRFIPKARERKNVGLRLVRHRVEDAGRRTQSLRILLENYR